MPSRIASGTLFATLIALSSASFPSYAAEVQTAPKPLTIPWIMRGPDLYGTEPADLRWSLDSKRVFFRWKKPDEPRRAPMHWFYCDLATPTAAPVQLTDDEARTTVPPRFSTEDINVSSGKKRIMYSSEGDLYLMVEGQPPVRLTDTPTITESAPQWAMQGKAVIYQQGENLFLLPLDGEDRTLRQLTDIRTGIAPKDEPPKSEGVAKVNEDIERELFDTVRTRQLDREESRVKRREQEEKRPRKPFYAGARQFVSSMVPAPDASQVAIFISEVNESTTKAGVVPLWINDDGFVSAPRARPNVGWDKNTPNRCVLLDVATGASVTVTLPDSLKGRGLSLQAIQFAPETGKLVLMGLADDWHDRWLFEVDRKTGAATIIDTLHDDAWVDGPLSTTFGFLPDGKTVYAGSEEGGWAHLVTISAEGTRKSLMNGPWETFTPQISADGKNWYFTSSEGDLGQRHFYRMPLEGGERTNLTASWKGIDENTALSPDEKNLAIIHSYTNRPPEVFIQENKPGAVPQKITTSPSAEFLAYPWRDVPVVEITARDGYKIHTRFFTPTRKTAAARAAVIFVHGAGYLQNAHKGWTPYPREYMFHHFLAEQGYTVLDVDYRGSEGYGRDSRTGIYKNMGGKDLNDVTDSARWLVNTQKIDPKRIGIYGGSYGGFLTLMALFKEPATFRAGAALRPVSDWSKYNGWYTSRILGLPQDDPAAYKRSSPIFFAEGLRGSLLMCHGMRDDNVFFQDTVRLAERLIELGKTDWETAIYPVESHGFTEPASWTDEYRRIFALFERTIGKPNPGK